MARGKSSEPHILPRDPKVRTELMRRLGLVSSTLKTATIVVNASRSAVPKQVRRVTLRAKGVSTPVLMALLAFIFTLPFDSIVTGSSSISKLAGILLFVCYLVVNNLLFQKGSFPPVPLAMRWFLVYLAIFAVRSILFGDEFIGDVVVRFLTLVQLFAFFWIASDVLRDKRTAQLGVLTYSVACVVLATGTLLKLPGFSSYSVDGRVTALGDNPNSLAIHMAIGVVSLIGLRFYGSYKNRLGKALLLGGMLPLLAAAVSTGSRGGILSLSAGLLPYLVPLSSRYPKQKLAAILIGLLAVTVTVYMVAENSYFMERWQDAYYEGNFAKRENIYPAAIDMVSERPVLGWDPAHAFYELGLRTGDLGGRDAHNTILWLLIEVGVIGTIPFLIGLWLCARAAWRARKGDFGVLPLALFLVGFAYGMSSTTLTQKWLWFVLALAVATRPSTTARLRKYSPVLLVTRSARSRGAGMTNNPVMKVSSMLGHPIG
jgi:O-antigen ligase